MNNVYRLKQKGAIEVTPLTFHKVRKKKHGWIWEGYQKLQMSDVTFTCSMWFHGSDEMTIEEAEHNTIVKGVRYYGKYYDAYWHCLISHSDVWMHLEGWFGFDNLLLKTHPLVTSKKNYNLSPDDNYTDEQQAELEELGFELIAC